MVDGARLDRGRMKANAASRRVRGVVLDGGIIESSVRVRVCRVEYK